MGRGRHGHGHSHGFGHHHRIGHHHHSHFSHHRSRGSSSPSFSTIMDNMHNTPTPPTLINGVYTFAGSEMAFRAHAEVQDGMMPLMMQMQMMPPADQMQLAPDSETRFPNVSPMAPQVHLQAPIQQANITLVGNKTKSSNNGCFIFTILCFCLIFPLCFMCCDWWKKMVSPLYELTTQAYQSIGHFLRANPTVTNLNLTVVDNAFSAEKASILAAAFGGSRVTSLTFVNAAIALNSDQNQLENFATNVQPIKSLNLTSSITWGDVIA